MNTSANNTIRPNKPMFNCDRVQNISEVEKNDIVTEVSFFNEFSEMLVGNNGSIDEVRYTFIASDDFSKKTVEQKKEILQKLDNLKRLIVAIDEFCQKHEIGGYNEQN